MKFKEQFPSLKNKLFDRLWNGVEKIDISENNGDGQLLYFKDIEKHCLDKLKVREVFDKVIEQIEDGEGISFHENKIKFYKELNLND